MRLRVLVLLALLPALAIAQAPPPITGPAHSERSAVDLKQGMTPAEVQQLLGKPRRTALRSGAADAPWQGTLQWTYAWNTGASASSSQRSLTIDFAAKAVEQWYVSGWSWSNY